MYESETRQATITSPHRSLPSVSVVIPAYTMDRWPLLRKAVESLRVQTVAVDAIVLCIDNNDELLATACSQWRDAPGTPVQVLANRFDDHLRRVTIHQRAHGTTRRFGAGSARNVAAEHVHSGVIAFMDDDAWAEPDWLERLLELYRDPSVVAVGGPPLPDYETRRPSWFPANFDWVFGCAYEGLPTETSPLRHLIGANMSVRRDAFAAVGGFHGSDFDDLNLCMRLIERYGTRAVYYTPQAVVHHFVPAERVVWRYYWRRCYFVNREKVRVFRRMGSAANLHAEREFVWRTLRESSWAALGRGLRGQAGGFTALGAMWLGIALAGLGHARGQLDRFTRTRAARRITRTSGSCAG
jgi:glucosyl-dolichyl phosphate glucuronosyltransferase